jgi:hypothetical protein
MQFRLQRLQRFGLRFGRWYGSDFGGPGRVAQHHYIVGECGQLCATDVAVQRCSHATNLLQREQDLARQPGTGRGVHSHDRVEKGGWPSGELLTLYRVFL